MASKEEASVLEYKKNKDRVSLLVIANANETDKFTATSHQKIKISTSFSTINVNYLPMKYRNQRFAWMNFEMFEKWFHNNFVPHVKQYLMHQNFVVLLIDNAPCHPE